MTTLKKGGLGRGIDALIPSKNTATSPAKEPSNAILKVAIEDIHPNRSQPRKTFDNEALEGLADSIRQHGLIEPILVRKRAQGYEIIAGERRWRACQKAGLKTVDVIVRDFADQESFLLALIENIQREDLNPIEEAEAYRQIIETKGQTQEQIADLVGKDRSTVANALRLLRLPPEVRRMVVSGVLSMGHARALLALETEDAIVKMAREVVKRGLSVRQVESKVRQERNGAQNGRSQQDEDPYAALPGGAVAIRRETDALMKSLGTRVRVVASGTKGKIEIDYASVEELDRLIARLKNPG